jgi:cytochrome c oxidase assembly protein subunit 15
MHATNDSPVRGYRALRAWLVIVIFTIFAMVIVGGLTRLTGSGLSMVDWQPILGALPPVTEAQWMERFDAYRQFPEYLKVNKGMSLEDFKYIFYWEYGHRLLGRSIGLIYGLPLLVFWMMGIARGRLGVKLFIALVLGGLQGLLGWYMVKSGLIDQPRVSHYRLAAHFSLAVFLMGYLFWIWMSLAPRKKVASNQARPKSGLSGYALALLALIAFQLVYGAMTAGLDAGLVYNSFPDWNGQWLPAGLASLEPLLLNLTANPVGVQFVHRTTGWVVLAAAIGFFVMNIRSKNSRNEILSAAFLLLAVIFQFALGVLTLIWYVPVNIASMHQGGALIVVLLMLWNVFLHRRKAYL